MQDQRAHKAQIKQRRKTKRYIHRVRKDNTYGGAEINDSVDMGEVIEIRNLFYLI